MRMKAWIGLLMAMLVVASGYGAEEENQWDFVVGASFVSKDFFADSDEIFNDYGWLGVSLGFEHWVGRNISVRGSCDVLFSGDDYDYADGSYMNTMVVPSIYGQWFFAGDRLLYLSVGASIAFPFTNSDYFDYSTGGFGAGGGLGVAFLDGRQKVEIGYFYLPVNVEATESGIIDDYNFGGPMIRYFAGF
ncbi:hypothetical protein PDESU_00642 [Pontiella desulfatans]|uniref:Outer membrane protein beta-barrel domain-containing protein n=2 Tax=Pontiella desulfatans TaxID=2750659 RepID=A0A6C2TX26_PONDE|nr:hypothetical protein PDESU_00642 [Pontiella desulfatans]